MDPWVYNGRIVQSSKDELVLKQPTWQLRR